jgi:hypothetical protein
VVRDKVWTKPVEEGPVLLALRANLTNLCVAGAIIGLLATAWAPVQAQDATRMATPGGAESTIETLLDTTTDALPSGHAVVAVDRWTLKPSATALTLPPRGEVVMIVVDSGAISATVAGSEHQFSPGETLTIGNQEVALRASDSEAAIAFLVYLISGF